MGRLVGGGFGGCRCLVVGLLFGCFSGFRLCGCGSVYLIL